MSKLAWMVLFSLVACSERVEWKPPTQVMARIESNTTEFEQLVVSVFSQQESGWTPASVTTFARADVRWPHDVAVVPKAGSARDHMFEVVVQLKRGGMVLAQQRKLTTFVAHQQRVLSFELWASACNGASPVCEPNDACHGDACPTCIAGSCVAAPLERDLPALVLGTEQVGADTIVDASAGVDASAPVAVEAGPELDPCTAGTSGCTGSCVSEASTYRCTCSGNDTLAVDGKTCRTQTWGTTETLSEISGSYISISMNATGTAYAVWNEPSTQNGQAWNELHGSLCTSYTCSSLGQLGTGAELNNGLFAHVTSVGVVSWTGYYGDSTGLRTIKGRRSLTYTEQTLGSYDHGSIAWFHKAQAAPYVGYYVGTDNTRGDAAGLHTFVGQADGTWSAHPVYSGHFGDYGSVVAFPNGTVMVMWGEATGTYWMSRLSAGTWSTAVMLGTTRATLQQTRAVVDASGLAHMFYAEAGTIHHTRVAEAGTLLSNDNVELPGGAGVVNFYASAGTKSVALAWTQGASSIGVSTWSESKRWNTTDFHARTSGSPNGIPTIALSRNDLTVQVVWGLTPLGARKQFVFSQSNDLGISWTGDPAVISTETPSQDMANDGEGRLMLVWSERPKPEGSGATHVRFFRETPD